MNDKEKAFSILEQGLKKYIPSESVLAVCRLLTEDYINLKVVPPRKTWQGAYRFPTAHRQHFISINRNLNQYAFLITLLHEIAHAHAWKRHKAKGHQKEWKSCYGQLLSQFMQMDIFPDDIQLALTQHIKKITYSSITDINLTKTLQKYDNNKMADSQTIALQEIPKNIVFSHNGMTFRKGEILRKYISCKNLINNRMYRCHPLMMVQIVKESGL